MNKFFLILLGLFPSLAVASSSTQNLDLTSHWAGYLALILFVIAYIFVMVEEFTHFRKSKPVILVAGILGNNCMGICLEWYASCSRNRLKAQHFRICRTVPVLVGCHDLH